MCGGAKLGLQPRLVPLRPGEHTANSQTGVPFKKPPNCRCPSPNLNLLILVSSQGEGLLDGCRRNDVTDFVAEHLNTPGMCGSIHGLHDGVVHGVPLLRNGKAQERDWHSSRSEWNLGHRPQSPPHESTDTAIWTARRPNCWTPACRRLFEGTIQCHLANL